MSITDRIYQYADYKGISISEFSKLVGVSNGYFAKQKANNANIGSHIIEKIVSANPGINLNWLILGLGEMISVEKKVSPKQTKKLSAQNIDLCAQSVSPIPEIERGVKCIDCAETPAGGIPLIPIDAAAGFLSGVGAQVLEYECERYLIPGFKGAEFLIRISGDSMTPKYESGDIVACQRLESDTFLQWNKVYVVDSEQGVLIKRIKPGRADDTLTLVSDNIEYAPFEIDRRQVFGLGRVIGLVRLE